MPALLGLLALTITFCYRVKISNRFLILIGGFVALFIAQSLIYQSISPKYFLLYPFNFWIAYCFVRAMRERFLYHLEYIVTSLAAISLIIWLADVVTGSAIRHLLSGMSVGRPYAPIVDSYIIVQAFINENVGATIPRNSGFAWEPGAFAVICCAGLLINQYRTGLRIRNNHGAVILIVALLSSQSTTGYSILMAFLLAKFWQQIRGAARALMVPLVSLIILFVFSSVPFMQSKIQELLAQDLHEMAVIASYEWNIGRPVAAQRFLSFQLDFADFLKNPWTGYGGQDEQMLVRQEGLNIISISGIGKIMAKFGIAGIAFFLCITAASSVHLGRQFGGSSPSLLLLYIVLVSISYSLVEHPLFLCLWCFWLFARPMAGISVPVEAQRAAGPYAQGVETT